MLIYRMQKLAGTGVYAEEMVICGNINGTSPGNSWPILRRQHVDGSDKI